MSDDSTATRDGETKTAGAISAGDGNYFFDLDELDGIDAGTGYSTAHGAVIEGQRMQVGRMHMPAGTGADWHAHPNEQFNYILQGTFESNVAGQEATATPGTLIYIPPDTEHRGSVVGDEDVFFFAVKDLSHGIIGSPVDPPSESTSGESSSEAADLETKTDGAIKGGNGNYHFDLDELAGIDAGPDYSTAHGAVIEGERMQAGVMRMEAGTGARLHTHPNEQFSYVLRGESHSYIDGQERTLTPGMLKYTPANEEHRGHAGDDEDLFFFTAKDMSHGIAGEPVDKSSSEAYYGE